MGEKLNAFISFYSLKAKKEVEEWKTKVAEDEVKWKKLTEEIYPAALKTATDLNQVETFQQVFPSPGTFIENVTKYSTLLGVDTGFEKQLKELYKWRNTKTQIANRKKYLAQAEAYVEKGGEDYISRLAHEIFSKAADAASRGAKFDSIIDSLFKGYPEYTEFLEDLIDHVSGPSGVLITPETYAALLEKKEAGYFTFNKNANQSKQSTETTAEKKVETSPINAGDLSKNKVEGSDSGPGTKSAINTGAEKKTEVTSVTSSEGQVTSKPGEVSKEILKPETKSPQTININLEKTGTPSASVTGKESPSSEQKSATVASAAVNENKSPQAINTNLGETKKAEASSTEKEKTESTTILNTNSSEVKEKILEKEKTSDSTEVKSTSSSVNTESFKSQENSTGFEKTSSTTSEGAVNSPKEEKKKGGFLSKLGKISSAVGSALNLPTFKELGSQAAGLFGATGAKFMSNVSDISQSFSKNSINSSLNQKRENSETADNSASNSTTNSNTSVSSANSNTSSTSTNSTSSNTQSASASSNIEGSQAATMNLEKNSPSMSVENKTTNVSTQNATSGGQVNSTSANSTTSPVSSTSTSNQTILPQPTASQPSSTSSQNMGSSPGVSVDLSGLAQSISRLEKILVSGIEVTIKDT